MVMPKKDVFELMSTICIAGKASVVSAHKGTTTLQTWLALGQHFTETISSKSYIAPINCSSFFISDGFCLSASD